MKIIRDTFGFRDLTSIVWNKSDTISLDSRKKSFFFGKGLQVKGSQKIQSNRLYALMGKFLKTVFKLSLERLGLS